MTTPIHPTTELLGKDRLADFAASGGDRLLVDTQVSASLSASDQQTGKLAAGEFRDVTNAAATGASRFLYNHDTGASFYDADGSGTGS